ncbi:hypothetical protein MVEN_02410600 [Mycena venus]|uniref:Uncharacterized protein n=1 Tax=Mycena venus TaxID=2733690 RepID=A0A8H7CDZ4_9AGAR|nr:hypothetical protein MVEN_02410600 [Mycena venus]
MEESPRPQKRARTTPPTDICAKGPENQLHGAQLLLALPSLLAHPPTHSEHKRALALSLLALRRCLGLPNPGRDNGSRGQAGTALDLSQPDECRAWCALAEIGLCVLEGGFGGEAWAAGVESEVDKALGKAAPIAQRHPSLASYPPYLTRLSARAAPHRARQLLRPSPSTFGSSAVANAGGTTAYYYTHLAWADHLLQAMLYPVPSSFSAPSATPKHRPALKSSSSAKQKSGTPVKSSSVPTREKDKDVQRDLAALRAALAPLFSAPHANVGLLARVIELRALIALGRWAEVGAALERAESAVGIVFPAAPAPAPAPAPTSTTDTGMDVDGEEDKKEDPPLYTTSPFHAALVVHILVLGVVWFAYSVTPASAPVSDSENGNGAGGKDGGSGSTAVSARLMLLYSLLDAGVYNGKCRAQQDVDMALESEGVLENDANPPLPRTYARFPSTRRRPPCIYVQHTHACFMRLDILLARLGAVICSKCVNLLQVGRKPKRKTFVLEGLGVVDREAQRELRVSRWASAGDVQAVELQMAKIKADLMCELIAVSIMRSEFDDAEKTLDAVIAHARTHRLFGGTLAHRVTLLHAQLAHALGRPARARTCYRVAARLAEEADDASGMVAARAGEVALLVGMRARARARAGERSLVPPLADEAEAAFVDVEDEDGEGELARIGKEVAGACRGLGGAMRAVGEVLEGVLTTEILKAKQHFRNALTYATDCQDNHLRALILALIAAHYLHTAGDQAQKMLATCEQLAAGLGAPGKKGKERVDAVGNAPLRLWAGERFLELHKRDGRDDLIQKREEANGLLRDAVVTLTQRERAQ